MFSWDHPSIITTSTLELSEDSGVTSISIRLTGGVTSSTSVDIIVEEETAKNNVDFEVSPQTVIFAAGADTQTIQVTIKDDKISEGGESFKLMLESGGVGHGVLYITIKDNDAGFVRLESGFVSRDITIGCSAPSNDYNKVEVYQQNKATTYDETALKIAENVVADDPIIFALPREKYTLDLTSSSPLTAELEIRNLNLSDSGYFWCVFYEDEPSTDTSIYEILLRVNPCVGSNSSFAMDDNTCIDLNDLVQVNVTIENVEEVSMLLVESTDRPDGIFTDADIMDVGDTLVGIVAVGDGSTEVTENVISAVDNILGSVDSRVPPTSQTTNNSTTRITIAVEQQVTQGLQQNNEVKVVESNLAVQGLRFNSSTIDDSLSGIGFGILSNATTDFTENATRTYKDMSSITSDGPPGYIFLTRDTVDELSDDADGDLSFVFVAYRNDFLFPSEMASKLDLGIEGVILTANVESSSGSQEDNVDVNNLADPVVTENEAEPERPAALSRDSCQFPQPRCVFWDFDLNDGAGDWSTEGCTYLGLNKTTGRRVCNCNHLTNFAVLVYHGKNTIKSTALDIISVVGCGLSIAALAITVVIFAAFSRLRRRARNILIHLCVSMIALYLVFVVAIDRTCPKAPCTLVAVLLHYFLLTTMAWMAVEARYLYIKLVKIFDPESEGFVLKSAIAAWGIPAIITGISLGAGFTSYQNENYCFPKVGNVVYIGILLPIGLTLIHNTISFVIIVRSIIRPRPGAGGRVRSQQERQLLLERFRNTIAISCLLGITWIFGFLAIDAATEVFQWLFCVFNSFQGVFIFIFFCLKQKDVRDTIASSLGSTYGGSSASSRSISGNQSSSKSRPDKSDTFHSSSPSDATLGSKNLDFSLSVPGETGFDNTGIELDVKTE